MRSKPDTLPLLVFGDGKLERRAPEVLQILVRQAKLAVPLFYSEVADEIGDIVPLGVKDTLGHIGELVRRIGRIHGLEIPPIDGLVKSKKTDLPGSGFDAVMQRRWPDYDRLTDREKQDRYRVLLAEAKAFSYWDEVLARFGLSPLDAPGIDPTAGSDQEKDWNSGGVRGAESEWHKALKSRVANSPKLFGYGKTDFGKEEVGLSSGDRLDVQFAKKQRRTGVEVKSRISSEDDLKRGLFQCVKYKAVLEAEERLCLSPRTVDVFLVIDQPLPKSLVATRNSLGVQVFVIEPE